MEFMKIIIFKIKMKRNQIKIKLNTNKIYKIKFHNKIEKLVKIKIIIMKILLMNTHKNKFNKINKH
jgi:hypothetical protein